MTKTRILQDGSNTFLLRIVGKGDNYGLNMCLTHDRDDPLIEFYDYDYDFVRYRGQKLGQFISRYRLSTLRSCELSPAFTEQSKHGLNLEGSNPKWSVSAMGMREAIQFINTTLDSEREPNE